MKAEHLIVGSKVQLDTGATAEILEIYASEHTVLVRFLDSPFEPGLVGSQSRCSEDEVTGFYEGDNLGHTTGQLA